MRGSFDDKFSGALYTNELLEPRNAPCEIHEQGTALFSTGCSADEASNAAWTGRRFNWAYRDCV